jgi:alginate O-acetyltransferase complex protein AlgI
MIDTSSMLVLLTLGAVPLAWALPRSWALDGVACWTVCVLALLAPLSAVWLLAAAILTPVVLQAGDRVRFRSAVATGWAFVLLAAFVYARLTPGLLWVGGSFFTLRHLHVIGEWWMKRLPPPGVREHLRYQLFLPVILVGPIHRIQNFNRQCLRRRWDAPEFLCGAERFLVGAFMAFVVGGWLIGVLATAARDSLAGLHAFPRLWITSALEWVQLYFVFAGLSAIALGASLMIGLRLEENFNRPWQATSLLEFWARWHMSLTHWVHDYVFRPVTALGRNAFLGLLAAMLVIGLWHEFSAYYVLWSFWQVLGVMATRLTARWMPGIRLPGRLAAGLGPLLVLAWLSLARPVIDSGLQFIR